MFRILGNGRTAMNAQQEKLDCISNNLANVSTTGYKKEEVNFQDLVYDTLKRKGYPTSPDGTKEPIVGSGVKAGKWIRNNSQGGLKETGVKTDLAIDGKGYYRVTLANGQKAYERAGNFSVDNTGTLVDKNGNKLDIELTEEGQAAIAEGNGLSQNNFSVNPQGEIIVSTDSATISFGKINLYNAVGDDALKSIGGNLYQPNEGSQMVLSTDADILQGYEETSNVDIAEEMSNMIMAQRAFELGSRAMKTADEMWGLVNGMKGR